MALVSFGGGGDPSGLFASLNRQHLQDIEALAERATNRAAERSDAEDRDMFDKWQNGLIDDDAWLDYIEERVVETAGDPEEHQRWIETQREYATSIADNKMEFAYENGTATINQVISYYKDRLSDMDKDSQAYREITKRLNEYVDKRNGDDIQSGAQDITDRIVMGKATIGDLIKFYQSRLSGLRKNSSLYEQIQQEIRDLQSRQIEQQYTGTGGSGGGGGGGGRRRSSGRRSSGGGGDWGTTSQQYAAATASGIVPHNSVVGAALEERDNRGVSLEARQFGGVLPGLSESDSDDYIQGARAHADYMLGQFADPNSDSIILDPNTGQEWENTPENAQIWAYEYIDLSEMRARGQETGRNQDYSISRAARNDIGEAVLKAQQANAIPLEEAEHRVTADYRRQLALAEQSGDPVNVMRVNSSFGRIFSKMGENSFVDARRVRRRRPDARELRPVVERAPEGIAERLIATGQLLTAYGSGDGTAIMQAQQQYRQLPDFDFDLVDTGPESWADLDAGVLPASNSPAAMSVVAARMRDGVESGSYMRVYDPANPGDGIAIVPTAVTQHFNPLTGQNEGSRAPISASFDPSRGDRWERIYTDDRNGNPVETWVISREVPIGLSTFVAGSGFEFNGTRYQSGTMLTESVLAGLTDTELKQMMDSGQIKLGPAGTVRSYSYRYGNTTVRAYWNEELQMWSDIPYMRQGLNLKGVNGTLAVVMTDDGGLGGHLRSYGHLQARPVQYHGKNPQKFQEMVDNGEIEIPHWGFRVDETGEVTPEENPHRLYWYDERMKTQQRGLWLNGAHVQWADPSVLEYRKKEDRSIGLLSAGMSDPKDRRTRQERGDFGIGPQNTLSASLGVAGVTAGIGQLMTEMGIFQGDPNGRSRGGSFGTVRAGRWDDDKERGESAFARVQAADRERARREREAAAARRISLPNIPLPRATGNLTPRTSKPNLPTVRTAVNTGGQKRATARPAPARTFSRPTTTVRRRSPAPAPAPKPRITYNRPKRTSGARIL